MSVSYTTYGMLQPYLEIVPKIDFLELLRRPTGAVQRGKLLDQPQQALPYPGGIRAERRPKQALELGDVLEHELVGGASRCGLSGGGGGGGRG